MKVGIKWKDDIIKNCKVYGARTSFVNSTLYERLEDFGRKINSLFYELVFLYNEDKGNDAKII